MGQALKQNPATDNFKPLRLQHLNNLDSIAVHLLQKCLDHPDDGLLVG